MRSNLRCAARLYRRHGILSRVLYLLASESIMERIRITENAIKTICNVLTLLLSSLSVGLICFLFFDFLLAIFHSLIGMFGKGGLHCLFKFFDRYGFHHIRVCAQCQGFVHNHISRFGRKHHDRQCFRVRSPP